MNLKKNIFGRTDFIDREGCGGARERRRWGREERLGGGSFVWVLSVSVEVDCLLSSVKRRRRKKNALFNFSLQAPNRTRTRNYSVRGEEGGKVNGRDNDPI